MHCRGCALSPPRIDTVRVNSILLQWVVVHEGVSIEGLRVLKFVGTGIWAGEPPLRAREVTCEEVIEVGFRIAFFRGEIPSSHLPKVGISLHNLSLFCFRFGFDFNQFW